jgi:hypothetical protein
MHRAQAVTLHGLRHLTCASFINYSRSDQKPSTGLYGTHEVATVLTSDPARD